MAPSYPLIPKSYKGFFPFRLGTTSYIYPEPILPNAKRLAPFLDEIELVLFESSGEDNLPDEQLIRDLKALSADTGVGFNVHLPMDVFLGDQRKAVKSEGVRTVRKFIERTSALSPSLYTLHFSLKDEKGHDAPDLTLWKDHLRKSAEEILECGVLPSLISIETLGYPYGWIEEIVRTFGFSTCLDLGHLLKKGFDLKSYLDRYLAETSVIHFHGLQNQVDHLGIDKLGEDTFDLILSYLRRFKGVLSIEVFTFDDLKNSLRVLEERWRER